MTDDRAADPVPGHHDPDRPTDPDDDPMSRACEGGCLAEPGEERRPGCLSWVQPARQETR